MACAMYIPLIPLQGISVRIGDSKRKGRIKETSVTLITVTTCLCGCFTHAFSKVLENTFLWQGYTIIEANRDSLSKFQGDESIWVNSNH